MDFPKQHINRQVVFGSNLVSVYEMTSNNLRTVVAYHIYCHPCATSEAPTYFGLQIKACYYITTHTNKQARYENSGF